MPALLGEELGPASADPDLDLFVEYFKTNEFSDQGALIILLIDLMIENQSAPPLSRKAITNLGFLSKSRLSISKVKYT
jgi:hypothetical protein